LDRFPGEPNRPVPFLRALTAGWSFGRGTIQPDAARALHQDHQDLEATLDRLREIADALDDAAPEGAVSLIAEMLSV
jgi:hypothetical protein